MVDPRSGVHSQSHAPGYGYCGRCRTPWKFVRRHMVMYTRVSGCFALCELCWEDLLTPEARLPFHEVLFRQWEWDALASGTTVGVEWDTIRQAIVDDDWIPS